jgi:2-polyprenyl-6-methoxyphenol hydroxylase-like FAD-dependent oxidoreductase
MAATSSYDVVIIGAGIGGGALATALSRAALSVLVLEKTLEHRDRVRGEWMGQWGVVEAKELGLYDAMIEAGGHHITRHVSYHEGVPVEEAEARALDLTPLVAGVPGPLAMGHPTTCNLFDRLAVESGAVLERGVDVAEIQPGASPSVRYTRDGEERTVTCRLIVGADGRGSFVRRQAGIELHADPQHHLFAGMLVEDAAGLRDDTQVIGAEKDVHFLVFPQGNGRARLYLGYGSEQHRRFTGDGDQRAFLDAFRLTCFPGSDAVVNATPAGPCNSYPNNDTWTETPYAEGVVLVGDAAGYNDPIIGQGLSITTRDVRLVRDALLGETAWSAAMFQPYAEERKERMRRLRFVATLTSLLENEFGPEAHDRRLRALERQAADPMLQLPQLAVMLGPHNLPEAVFDDSVRERLFAP